MFEGQGHRATFKITAVRIFSLQSIG